MENLLKTEKSPYLKQHKDNPVFWFPWNKKTLERAKIEKKPIFLSVGYASCHWCHVMAHESFENQETADIMNEKFINIKVDREERPDLDYVFQRSLSILMGVQGGWPLSMFLDENAVPFTGGTYFPVDEIQGRPNFKKILRSVSEAYKDNRNDIIAQAPQMQKIFLEINKKTSVREQSLEPFMKKILPHLDEVNGGFKGAPKFPYFYMFDALFYFFLKTKKSEYLKPVETLLVNISSKGIYDQIGGGISRYTVDERWIIPHFEKMLYDNIQYIDLLTKYFQYSKNNYFKNKLIQTINFMNVEFLNNESLYGSAYDADSDGVEGKFYVWTYNELKEIAKDDLIIFKKKYEISINGNFEGSNILIENKNYELSAQEAIKINQIEVLLMEKRLIRQKPLFDNKAQTDLNAFFINSLIHASIVLEDAELKNKILNTAKVLERKLSKKIYHCFESDEIDVFLEDYAYYSLLHLSLYEVDGDRDNLKLSINTAMDLWNIFYDKKTKLLQKNKISNNDLFAEPVDVNDNNIPNGNSVYLGICNKLYKITNDKIWLNRIELLKESYHSLINSNFSQMFSFIKTLDICEEGISFTFNGNFTKNNEILIFLQKEYFGRATFIYNKNEKDSFIIICKNSVCSDKLSNIKSIKQYLDTGIIN